MKEPRTGQYDLENRTFDFAKEVRTFVKQVPKTVGNIEDSKQVVRSSGSTGANYIEANEALSKKDFLVRIKICRKEAKETRYWLRLIDAGDGAIVNKRRDKLVQEANELTNIRRDIEEKRIKSRSKFGIRNPKLETNSNDETPQF